MILSLFLFFLISLLILFSTIGYGLLVTKFLKFENFNYNYGLIGFLGLFILSIIASLTHLFAPHNYIHNILIILIGITSLITIDRKKFEKLKYILIVFVLLFICILMAKNNEDFGFYHLPNSLQFAQQKLQFGLGNLNHGFKHISSLFMIMSLNYLPLFEYYIFNLTNLLFLTFLVSFILIEIYLRKKNNLNLTNLILCLFLILFLAKFSRLAEYGSDISGQIIIAIYFFYLLEFFYNKKIELKSRINYLKLSMIMITFAISLKFISVIYSVLLLILFISVEKKKQIILKLLKIDFLFLIFLSLSLFIFLNFSATGCLIYPVEKLCFSEKFKWAISSETVNYLNLYYEVWAKGGAGPGFGTEDQEKYVLNSNWIPNWFKVYFIGKFSDYILVTLLILIIFISFFYKDIFLHKNKLNKKKKNYSIIYLSIILIFLLWFFNFPTLRYAGYIIVFSLLTFPFIFLIEKKINFHSRKVLKKISIIFLISYTVFLTKNITRINDELKLKENDHHNFKNFPFFWTKNSEFKKVVINGHDLYLTEGACWSVPSTCIRGQGGLNITKKNNYIFYHKE